MTSFQYTLPYTEYIARMPTPSPTPPPSLPNPPNDPTQATLIADGWLEALCGEWASWEPPALFKENLPVKNDPELFNGWKSAER